MIPLRTGLGAGTGVSADIDEFDLDVVISSTSARSSCAVLHPREPRHSSAYRLAILAAGTTTSGSSSAGCARILEHLSLGTRVKPAAIPPCSQILAPASLRSPAGERSCNGLLASVLNGRLRS